MNKLQFNIMIRAVQIRLAAGESLDDIFASYPKLTEDEREELRKMFS